MITIEQIKTLPLFVDGSDGSMWRVNAAFGEDSFAVAEQRFVRLSDLLSLFENRERVLNGPTAEYKKTALGPLCRRECGCNSHQICSSCNPEEYYREIGRP